MKITVYRFFDQQPLCFSFSNVREEGCPLPPFHTIAFRYCHIKGRLHSTVHGRRFDWAASPKVRRLVGKAPYEPFANIWFIDGRINTKGWHEYVTQFDHMPADMYLEYGGSGADATFCIIAKEAFSARPFREGILDLVTVADQPATEWATRAENNAQIAQGHLYVTEACLKLMPPARLLFYPIRPIRLFDHFIFLKSYSPVARIDQFVLILPDREGSIDAWISLIQNIGQYELTELLPRMKSCSYIIPYLPTVM
jgi:hypothetical protein